MWAARDEDASPAAWHWTLQGAAGRLTDGELDVDLSAAVTRPPRRLRGIGHYRGAAVRASHRRRAGRRPLGCRDEDASPAAWHWALQGGCCQGVSQTASWMSTSRLPITRTPLPGGGSSSRSMRRPTSSRSARLGGPRSSTALRRRTAAASGEKLAPKASAEPAIAAPRNHGGGWASS